MNWKYVVKFPPYDPEADPANVAYEIFYLTLEKEKVLIDYALESDEEAMNELIGLMQEFDTRSAWDPNRRTSLDEDDLDDMLHQLADWGDKYQVWVGP